MKKRQREDRRKYIDMIEEKFREDRRKDREKIEEKTERS